jgi:flagellar hook-associated protein 1 FlgK
VPTVVIDVASIAQLTTSDYRLDFDGSNYNLTRFSDNQVQTFAALPQTVDGMTIAAGSWVPDPSDSILIQPTRAGAQNINVAFSDARQVAAAAPIRSSAGLSNRGSASISAGTVNGPPPVNANLQHKVSITFTNATTFDVFDVTAAAPIATIAYVAGAAISYNGWTAQISGSPASGDVFTIDRNSNGVADNRNAALLGALQTSNTMNAGAAGVASTSYQGAYAQIVSAVGSKANEVTALGAAQQGLADQSYQALQSLSGVNLDEEAANLMRYQQAYQASAKVLEIAGRVFDEILALGR